MPPILSLQESFLLIADEMYPPPPKGAPEPVIDAAAVAERMHADIEVVLALVRYFAAPDQGCILARFDNECQFTARGREAALELEARLLKNAMLESGAGEPRASAAAVGDTAVDVTQREVKLLSLLAAAPDQKLPRTTIPLRVGDPPEIVEAELLELYIKGLVALSQPWAKLTPKGSKALERAGPPRLLRIWGRSSKGLRWIVAAIVAVAAVLTALSTIKGKFADLFIRGNGTPTTRD